MRRRLMLGSLASIAVGWCAGDDDSIWRAYLEWFRGETGPVPDARAAYRDHLLRAGLSEEAAAERTAAVERLMRERRAEWEPAFFDRTYRSESPRFNTKPNALLVDAVKGVKPGRALDIHMGQGRNAVYLAKQGWRVTGFDFSKEGVAAARKAAREAGVSLDALVARHEEFEFGSERWDLIVMSYTWVPLEAKWIESVSRALKPGGLIVFEHLIEETGSENAARWLPRPNELLQVFGHLRIVRYEDVRAMADWAWRPERIARLVAEKSLAAEDAERRE